MVVGCIGMVPALADRNDTICMPLKIEKMHVNSCPN